MRAAILSLTLALALPLIPVAANADGHACDQLRNLVRNNVPPISRNLPYDSLDCAAISEIHLLATANQHLSSFRLNQRIEAVFRREGLIR